MLFKINSKFFHVTTNMTKCYSTIQICSYPIRFQKQIQALNFSLFFFNEITWQTLHIITIYKPPQMNTIFFHFHFRKHSYKNPYKLSNHNNWRFYHKHVDKHNWVINIKTQHINTHNFHITFIKNTTPNNTQIDHIWTNAPKHPSINVILDQHKFIGHIITLYTLHSNYVTIFLNLIMPSINEQSWNKK